MFLSSRSGKIIFDKYPTSSINYKVKFGLLNKSDIEVIEYRLIEINTIDPSKR